MLHLPSFRYLAPRSLSEAVGLLAELGAEAQLLAGGTDLLPLLKRGQLSPRYLVALAGVPELSGIRTAAEATVRDGSGLTLGALTSIAELTRQPVLRRHFPVIGHAASLIATPTLRSMGTLGGNLCLDTRCTYVNRSPLWREAAGDCLKCTGDVCRVAPGDDRCWAAVSSDLAPAMIALDAQIRIAGPRGERVIPAEALYRDDGLSHLTLSAGEIVVDVQLLRPTGVCASYMKLRPRASFDFPSLGVAVALRMAKDECENARVVVGAVASRPLRIAEAEVILTGHVPTAERLSAAADAVHRAIRPMDNVDLPPGYRRQVARVFTERALQHALRQVPARAGANGALTPGRQN
ncbi:MAG: FAD binding domain-containing protein [Ardenticatenales bacterium]|nr:FAD binding domain-containing protein [Ardenticatenales bacterium]